MPINLEKVAEREAKPIYKLNTEPLLLYSPYLSRKTGLELWILDYSYTSTGTHKLIKSIKSVQEARKKERGIFLFINPVVDLRKDSNGSGVDSLELASAVYYPKSQIISVVNSKKTYLKPEPINKDFPYGRKRIVLGLDLNKFWGKERLEDYFKDIISGKIMFDKKQVKETREILEKKGLKVENCVDLTNLDDCGCYVYSEGLVKRLKDFNYLVGSAGTGERALGQIESIKNERLKHIIAIPNGHPLDPFHRYEKSDAKRIQTRFRIKTHNKLLEESLEREDIIYKSVGLFGGRKAKETFVDKVVENGLNIKSSPDGAIGFTILRERNNPKHEHYFNNNGLKVFNTHKASETGFNYIYNTLIPYGSKVCIINTGLSNNTLLNQLIKKGIVK